MTTDFGTIIKFRLVMQKKEREAAQRVEEIRWEVEKKREIVNVKKQRWIKETNKPTKSQHHIKHYYGS